MMRLTQKVYSLALFLTVIAVPLSKVLAKVPPVALSASENQIIPLDRYTCQQKIFAHVHWSALQPGAHHLDAFWHLPTGAVQEHTAYDFVAPAESAVVWLQTEKPFFQLPMAGVPAWDGRWTVEVFIDGHSLGRLPFELRC